MSANEIHVGDAGTTIRATIQDESAAVDLSSSTFTSVVFILKSPAGTLSSVTATAFVTAGTDGAVAFTSTSTTFNTSGSWKIQARVTIGSNTWNSDVQAFDVFPNL